MNRSESFEKAVKPSENIYETSITTYFLTDLEGQSVPEELVDKMRQVAYVGDAPGATLASKNEPQKDVNHTIRTMYLLRKALIKIFGNRDLNKFRVQELLDVEAVNTFASFEGELAWWAEGKGTKKNRLTYIKEQLFPQDESKTDEEIIDAYNKLYFRDKQVIKFKWMLDKTMGDGNFIAALKTELNSSNTYLENLKKNRDFYARFGMFFAVVLTAAGGAATGIGVVFILKALTVIAASVALSNPVGLAIVFGVMTLSLISLMVFYKSKNVQEFSTIKYILNSFGYKYDEQLLDEAYAKFPLLHNIDGDITDAHVMQCLIEMVLDNDTCNKALNTIKDGLFLLPFQYNLLKEEYRGTIDDYLTSGDLILNKNGAIFSHSLIEENSFLKNEDGTPMIQDGQQLSTIEELAFEDKVTIWAKKRNSTVKEYIRQTKIDLNNYLDDENNTTKLNTNAMLSDKNCASAGARLLRAGLPSSNGNNIPGGIVSVNYNQYKDDSIELSSRDDSIKLSSRDDSRQLSSEEKKIIFVAGHQPCKTHGPIITTIYAKDGTIFRRLAMDCFKSKMLYGRDKENNIIIRDSESNLEISSNDYPELFDNITMQGTINKESKNCKIIPTVSGITKNQFGNIEVSLNLEVAYVSNPEKGWGAADAGELETIFGNDFELTNRNITYDEWESFYLNNKPQYEHEKPYSSSNMMRSVSSRTTPPRLSSPNSKPISLFENSSTSQNASGSLYSERNKLNAAESDAENIDNNSGLGRH